MTKIEEAVARAMFGSASSNPQKIARAFIDALAATGYVIVPREPTEAMVRAGTTLFSPKAEYHGADAEVVWDAMLGAASQLTE